MSTKSHKIGIILGSTRSPRVCPQIGTFITNTLTPLLPSSVEFSLIDISINPLPMYDEPGIPSLIPESSGYTHTHTQTWSHLISSHDAFIFITPQYNWGYPASLKNAIDYLFFEWRAKPTMIVSYGGHGGGKAASQLRQVLEGGLKMKVVETMPALTFPDRDVMRQASRGEELALPEGAWEKEGEDVKRGFGEMLRLLGDS
ncbi:NADPH-dependent FMN reductase-domain-containing protein [Leptodontidium sp. 2 PMI_412]|nr:NADPH-dependent FMN reductase-domain-containing protein [Leptodontidium sp. 2 PMI_412]